MISRQHGMTLIGFLFVLAAALFVAYIGMKLVPIYLNHYSLVSAMKSLADEPDAPNMTEDNVLMTYITTPLDIENKLWDMQKGGIKQGAYLSLQMGNFRPNQFCSQHRTPINNFYVNGASTYSGGTVIFGPVQPQTA